MQQTQLDHWLKKRFSHITRIYCNVLPQGIPAQALIEEAPEGKSSSHRYRITSPSDEVTDGVISQFRLQGITFAARVDEGGGMVGRMVTRPRRSFTYDMVWLFGGLSAGVAALVLCLWFGVFPKLYVLVTTLFDKYVL